MNTRTLMLSSTAFASLLGLAGTFLPREILAAAGVQDTVVSVITMQLTGALYLGFAMLNWMSRGAVIGGIYARPLVVANLLHFMAGGLALLHAAVKYGVPSFLWIITALYAVFAIAFGLAMMTSPQKTGSPVSRS